MNMATAVRFYVDKIVADPKISGQSAPHLIAPLAPLGLNAAGVYSSTPCVSVLFIECSFVAMNCKLLLL